MALQSFREVTILISPENEQKVKLLIIWLNANDPYVKINSEQELFEISLNELMYKAKQTKSGQMLFW